MIKIGLTGGIGSGKTKVAKWFANRGIKVFDADQIVHHLFLQPEVIFSIKQEFGSEYMDHVGINRTLLGSYVFNHPEAKKRLEKLLHPLVFKEMSKACEESESRGDKIIILDIPLLYETGWERYVDEVWVVYVPHRTQVDRIMVRNKMTLAEAEQRIAAQIPLEDKTKMADRVIDNSGSWDDTKQQLAVIWGEIIADRGTNLL